MTTIEKGIVEQWNDARSHPFLALFGAAWGGLPPLIAYCLVHVPGALPLQDVLSLKPQALLLSLVLGACVLFSVNTVYDWGVSGFGRKLKAICIVVAVEGVMVAAPAPIEWLAQVALLYLIGINAIATSCTLARKAPPQPTVTDVARKLGVPRREAAKVVDRQLAQKPRPA